MGTPIRGCHNFHALRQHPFGISTCARSDYGFFPVAPVVKTLPMYREQAVRHSPQMTFQHGGPQNVSWDPQVGMRESSMFLHQFASGKKYQKTPLSIFSMHQGVKEPLRGYIQRFNVATLEVPSASADVLSNTFAQGLNDGEFLRSLAKKPPTSFNNLLTRAEKYVNMKEAT
ncbi:hypothetical protein BUALT_Bualt02G0113300 [Buddleja alternifolia]|uniref:Retrotransposon gag domain-containing protein n=1 Tax=Buddleja alternifolia TaxID=168488 RepID=A0AAV6YAF5_9LAMI|nr:hypothetical protein BUALT_Bualt02G0113300 [Buddleja alternifolia]